jgi:hypothetical protein
MPFGADIAAGVAQVIAQAGNPTTYTDATGTVHTIRMAVTSVDKEDTAIANAVGIEGAVGYILPSVTPVPAKFDTMAITTSGRTYTVEAVHPLTGDNRVVGYKLLLAG